jgi:hypothetical protein
MASYQPLTSVNHEEDEDIVHTPRYSLEESEDSQLIYSAKHDYAELEVDDSSAHEEALLRQDPIDESPSILRLPTDGGSIFESFVNMANSIVGAGIIGLPFAFKEAVRILSFPQATVIRTRKWETTKRMVFLAYIYYILIDLIFDTGSNRDFGRASSC